MNTTRNGVGSDPRRSTIRQATVALALIGLLVAGCGAAHPSGAEPSASAASDGAARALQAEFVDVVKAVSPSVVVIETDEGLGSGIVYDVTLGELPG